MTTVDSNNDSFSGSQWLRDLDERAKRWDEENRAARQESIEIGKQLVAKMQAMQEMGDLSERVRKRLLDGEWDKCRGLPREQQHQILKQMNDEELVLRMQQDVANRPAADWEEHRRRRIELIKWSALAEPEKEQWIKFYSQAINLNEGENYVEQPQKHSNAYSP